MTAESADFNRQLADREEASLDEIFVRRGREQGINVLSAAEIAAGPMSATADTGAGNEPAPVSPWAHLNRGRAHQPADLPGPADRDLHAPIDRRRQIEVEPARAREPEPERAGFDRAQPYTRPRVVPNYPGRGRRDHDAPAKPRRKQITVHTESVPIDLIDARTGDVMTVYMRSVPTTELPYLDRHDLMLQDIRMRMARVKGRDRKEHQQLERYAAEYNAIAEEMTRFVIDMPDGMYETLDVPTLRALQREISQMVQGNQGADESDDDPNW